MTRAKKTVSEEVAKIAKRFASLRDRDTRTVEEILGYDDISVLR